jgi:hypothetical protein
MTVRRCHALVIGGISHLRPHKVEPVNQRLFLAIRPPNMLTHQHITGREATSAFTLLAQKRSDDWLRNYLIISADLKSSAHGQNGKMDSYVSLHPGCLGRLGLIVS